MNKRLFWPTLLCGFLCLLVGSPLAAQPNPTSGRAKSAETKRSSAESPDFFNLLRSGGDLLVDLVRSEDKEPTVENPEWNSQESPRHAVLTFLEAMRHVEYDRNEAWPRAEKTLAMPVDSQLNARQTAELLKDVFDRLSKVSPGSLPDKKKVEQENISRYPFFPAAIEHQWIWSELEEAPQGTIVLMENAQGHWQFDPETLAGIEKLADSMRPIPPRSESRQRGELFLNSVMPVINETPWWGWLALLGGLAGGVLLAWLAVKLLNRMANACQQRDWPMIAQAWVSLGKPFTLLLVALGILLGSAPIRLGVMLEQLRWNAIEMLLLLAVGWLAVELIDLAVVSSHRFFANEVDNYVKMGTTIVRRALRITAGIILSVFVLQNLFDVNLTALLGGLGLLTLAISLAAQDAVKNLFGALMVFANRPFLVGDWIAFKGEMGEVEDVSLQVTRIRLLSGEVWTVPNMHFTTDPVENLSLRKYLRREMNVAITYDTPPEKIQRALAILENILTCEEVVGTGLCDLKEQNPVVSFNEFGSHYLNLRVYYWYFMSESGNEAQRDTDRGWFSYLDHCSLVNQRLVEGFNAEGINFAFPTHTVFLTDDPDRHLTISTANGQEQRTERAG